MMMCSGCRRVTLPAVALYGATCDISHVFSWILLFLLSFASAQNDGSADSEEGDKPLDWMVIFGYVCFAIGAILIIFGFARLIWWALWERKYRKEPWRRRYLKKNFNTMYYKDPWLREPSLASMVSRHRNTNGENNSEGNGSLRLENEAIYAQPVDATNPKVPYMAALHPGTEQELSQTESQIYGSGNGGSRSNGSHKEDRSIELDDGAIYSVPDKFVGNRERKTGRSVPTVDEFHSHLNQDPPALPSRDYVDTDSLSEADMNRRRNGKRDMQQNGAGGETGYPDSSIRDRRQAHASRPAVERDYNGVDMLYPSSHERDRSPERDCAAGELGYPESSARAKGRSRERSPERDYSTTELGYPEAITHAHVHSSRRSSSSSATATRNSELRKKHPRPRQLSSRELLDQAADYKFKDNSGHQVPFNGTGSQPPTTPGSVKSMKSLYQYMLSEEPLGLDREMDYHFVSSYH